MSYPTCVVEIFGKDEQWTLDGGVSSARPYGDAPATDLISCRVEKHLHYATPAGSFSLGLSHHTDKLGRSWGERIKPQDLVVIQMLNYGQQSGPHGQGEQHTVMIGLVDTVSIGNGVDTSGKPERDITVQGHDFGKLFQSGNVTYWSFLGASMLGARRFDVMNQLNAHPHEVVEKLLTDIFFKFIRPEWTFNEALVKFEDVMGYALTSYQSQFPGGVDIQFLQSEQSFWSFFVKVASIPFHEVYVDTRRSVDIEVPIRTNEESIVHAPARTYGNDHSSPVLIMRPPPFPALSPDKSVDTESWDNQPQHLLSEDAGIATQRETLSISAMEQFNLYLIFPRGGIISETQYLMSVPPILDTLKFRKYGYRPLMPHASIFNDFTSNSEDNDWFKFYRTLAWRLAGWNVMNDRLWSGTKEMQLSPHIHVGERLLDQSNWHKTRSSESAGKEFYVESVRHEFVTNQHARTTLGVTRGLSELEARQYRTTLELAAQDLEETGADLLSEYRTLIGAGQAAPQ